MRTIRRVRRLLAITTFALLLMLPAPRAQAQPPTTAAAQDGFVPVSQMDQPQERMPAPVLLATAYGFVWVMLLGYMVSIWRRVGQVERDLQEVSRRIGTGERRP